MVAVDTDHMSQNAEPAHGGPPLNGRSGASAPVRSFVWSDYPLERIRDAKCDTTVSVALPARNEAATVGPIVSCLRSELLDTGVIDELLVVDDHSSDDTAAVAAAAGATVSSAEEVLSSYGEGHGKGEVLWKSLFETSGEIVLWCDTDLVEFDHRFVSGLLGPLLCEDGVEFVKGHYDRPEDDGGGGRVTELVAKPLISLLFPELASLRQPLSGEYGGRRELLEQLPFTEGYGVELGLLVDISRRFGTSSMAQVDLEVRHHRNRPLAQLSPQATAILRTALHKVDPELLAVAALAGDAELGLLEDTSAPLERPPMVEVAEYLARHAPEALAV